MLRKLTKEDYRALTLFSELISKESEYLAPMHELVAKQVLDFTVDKTAYGIFEDSAMVGEIFLTVKKRCLKIVSVGVLSRVKGRGYAKLLLETAYEEALCRNLCELKLTVRKDNLPAIALYESVGYRRIGQTKTNFTYRRQVMRV